MCFSYVKKIEWFFGCNFFRACLNKWFEKQRRCPLHENLNEVEEDDVQVVS